MNNEDYITSIEDEIPNIYHIVSSKVGELGIIFIPEGQKRYCFRQTDTKKYLKPFHVISVLHELNKKNGVEKYVRDINTA